MLLSPPHAPTPRNKAIIIRMAALGWLTYGAQWSMGWAMGIAMGTAGWRLAHNGFHKARKRCWMWRGKQPNCALLPPPPGFLPPPLQLMESDQCSQREEALTINRDHVILPETRSPPGPELVDTCTRMTSPIFTANLQRQD